MELLRPLIVLAVAAPLALGGVFALDDGVAARWGPAPAWRLPVGEAHELGVSSSADEPAFHINRGLEYSHHRLTHQGADLANGRAGDTVRVAASGLVVLAFDGDNGNGYGGHVVVAHHIEDGQIAYSVYAHLAPGTIAVQPGQLLCEGDPIARVGQTGRASTPHLHFEVRRPDAPSERWEKARAVDPLMFVRERFGVTAGGSDAPADGAQAYEEWALAEGVLARGTDLAAPLTRAAWWRMLAASLEDGPDADLPPVALRDSLMDSGVLPEEEADAPPEEHLSWAECARDVHRMRQFGTRMPHGPLAADAHAAACESRFGQRSPSAHAGALRRRNDEPSASQACVLLADVSGPAPRVELRAASGGGHAGRPRKPRHAHPARHHHHHKPKANAKSAKRKAGKAKASAPDA